MAIKPFTNYASIPINTPDYGISNILPSILKGYQAAKAPETHKTEMDLKRAQTEKALAEALESKNGGKLQGFARDRQDLDKLRQIHGEDSEVYQGAARDFQLREKLQNSLLTQREQIHEFRPWNSLSQDEKADVMAKYRGMGIHDQKQAISLWNNEQTPEAIQSGFSGQLQNKKQAGNQNQPQSNNPQAPVTNKQYVPTGANRTTINETEGYLAESDFLGEKIDKYNEKYAQTYGNVSPQYYADTILGGSDPKIQQERAEYIAGQIMAPDRALISIRLAGASNAREAVNDLMERMGSNAKIYGWTKNSKDFKRAMEIVRHDLNDAARMRIEGMKGVPLAPKGKTESKPKENNIADGMGIMDIININRKGKK